MTRIHAVTGRVVDERGAPMEGLLVGAHRRNHVIPDSLLGTARTGPDGSYRIEYRTRLPEVPLLSTALQVTLHDPTGIRLLAQSDPLPPGGNSSLEVPPLQVARAHASGWPVTLGEAEPQYLSSGNEVNVYVDGEHVFEAITAAVDRARERVHLTQFLFEPDFQTTFPNGRHEEGRRLVDALLAADDRGVKVRILIRETPVFRDSSSTLPRFFATARDGAHQVEVRTYPLPLHTLHAKTVVVDDEEAFIVGPPFEQRYWDTRDHGVHEPRREDKRPPLHDLAIRLRGPAAHDVATFFAALWNCQTAEGGRLDVLPRAVPAGPQVVQVARTIPPAQVPDCDSGELGIIEAYERALAHAQEYVYLENQYFTNGRITEALLHALRRNPRLEAVLVLNEDVDVPTYIRWQNHRIMQIRRSEVADRVGIFTLLSTTRDGDSADPIYIHSKCGIVDDCWATVGSANLDGISMESAFEFGVHNRCNFDLNAILYDGIDGLAPSTGAVHRLRATLWAEHLGRDASEFGERPANGWLPVWSETAAENAARRDRGEGNLRGFILPYGADAAK